MEKNTGKVREFCHPGKVGTLLYKKENFPSTLKNNECLLFTKYI